VWAALGGVKFGGGTSLFDTIAETCTQIMTKSRYPDIARQVIVLVSDGEDDMSSTNPQGAEELAQKDGVAIFSLVIRSQENRGESFMKKASQDTGGLAFVPRNLTEGVAALLAAIQQQWVLNFTPLQDIGHKSHTLVIKSLQKDVHLSAPANIYNP
jgi:hypothetical protein